MKVLFLLIFLLAQKPYDGLGRHLYAHEAQIEGEIIMGNSLPRFAKICIDAEVRSSARNEDDVMFIVPAGEIVNLRDKYLAPDGTWWMMIGTKPPKWINGNNLCQRGE